MVAAVFAASDAAGLWSYITGKQLSPGFVLLVAVLLVSAGAIVEVSKMDARLSDLSSDIRLTAQLGSLSGNLPDPGPDKSSLRVTVFWEIWVGRDVSTDELALNVVYMYDRTWWKVWESKRRPQHGLPRLGVEHTQYRHRLAAADPQPFKDHSSFEYVGPRLLDGDPHWLLELVLKTGMPKARHTAAVYLNIDELRSRGSNPPI